MVFAQPFQPARWVPLLGALCLLGSPLPVAAQGLERPEPTRLQLPDPIVTSQTQFDIPFNTDDLEGRLVEVQLYVSTDLGESWNLYARQSPQKKKIPFQSVGDGEYLFALKTLDRDRRLLPIGPPIPTLRIAIDTQDPQLQLQIDPDKDGRIAATWLAEDSNLDRSSLSLSYRIAEPNAPATWVPVPTGTSLTESRRAEEGLQKDRIVWWPDTSANAIIVKAEIKDHAGNLSTVYQPVGLSAYRPTPSAANSLAESTLAPPDPNLMGAEANKAYKPIASNSPLPDNSPINWPVDAPNTSAPAIVGNLAYQSSQPNSQKMANGAQDPFRSLLQKPAEPGSERDGGGSNMMVAQGSTVDSKVPGSPVPQLAEEPRSQFIPQEQLANRRPQQAFSFASSAGQASNQVVRDSLGAPNNSANAQQQFPTHPSTASSAPTGSSPNQPSPNRSPSSYTGTPPTPWNSSRSTPATEVSSGGRTPAELTRHRSIDQESSNRQPLPPNQIPERAGPRSSQATAFPFLPGTYFVVNQKRFRLRYHIDGLSPNQIGSVAIFGSTDMGKTWRLWTTDQDKVSPVSIDAPEQGRYAFRVVVTNLGGLASEIPAAGTPPELVIDVDLTAPTPKITAAPYGKDSTRASLIIQWDCPDQDLPEAPVAIAYSDSQQGPWTTITQATPNTGQYEWVLHPNLPTSVYLRMAVVDKAGNKGFYQLPQPINLAPLIPRGRILGLEK